mmetsp:Transcript_29710/g.69088  ORF Transcript_29710/g.69088 Transcript_29710/m.69088 type:complete len:201 (-) Transcript_29710:1995-2597(-)
MRGDPRHLGGLSTPNASARHWIVRETDIHKEVALCAVPRECPARVPTCILERGLSGSTPKEQAATAGDSQPGVSPSSMKHQSPASTLKNHVRWVGRARSSPASELGATSTADRPTPMAESFSPSASHALGYRRLRPSLRHCAWHRACCCPGLCCAWPRPAPSAAWPAPGEQPSPSQNPAHPAASRVHLDLPSRVSDATFF